MTDHHHQGDDHMPGETETTTLGGGCFWCLEAVFEQLQGVLSVQSGYAGGSVTNPTYEQVCTGTTGHAEVVQIRFDPSIISYADLLSVFFTMHDPTTLNRQGPDSGTQYRSAVFFHSEEQERITRETIQSFEKERVWKDPIVTEVTALDEFFPAEDYHNEYFRRNRYQPYCQAIIEPKVTKLRQKFLSRLKQQ